MEFRPYRAEDKEAVLALHRLALQDTGAFVDDPAWDADLNDIGGAYFQNRGFFLVVMDGGQLVAMGAVHCVDDDTAEIKRMRVHPDWQGKGIGKKVLKALEDQAVELEYRSLILDTTTKQTAAQKLYEGAGYSMIRTSTAYGLDILHYHKNLDY